MSGVVTAARAAVGTRFRLHGRGADGLDCVGLVAAALHGAGWSGAVPDDYPVATGDPGVVGQSLARAGLRAVADAAAGDVVLFRSAPGQLHLAIDTGSGVVHADAGLRRVVERPGEPPWPLVGRWRWEEKRWQR